MRFHCRAWKKWQWRDTKGRHGCMRCEWRRRRKRRGNGHAGALVEHCQEIVQHLIVDGVASFHHGAVDFIIPFHHVQHHAVRFIGGLEQLHDAGILLVDHRRQKRKLGVNIRFESMEKLMNLVVFKRERLLVRGRTKNGTGGVFEDCR